MTRKNTKAETSPEVARLLESFPDDRRAHVAKVREVVLGALPEGFEEGVDYGMLVYTVPLARFPKTYNKKPLMVAALGSKKDHMAVHLVGLYGDPGLAAWFEEAYRATGKKLDMGKACVRFRDAEALPLPVIAEAVSRVGVERMIAMHEAAHGAKKTSPRPREASSAAKKAPAGAKKSAPEKAAAGTKKSAPEKASAPKKTTKRA